MLIMDDEYKTKRFGEKLRTLRKSRHLSMKDLASQFGYTSHSYVSEVETAKKQPTVEFILKTARFFDVSTDVLLKDELDLPPYGE